MSILWMIIIQYYEYNNVMLPRQIIVDLFFKFIMEVIIHVMLPPVLLIIVLVVIVGVCVLVLGQYLAWYSRL